MKGEIQKYQYRLILFVSLNVVVNSNLQNVECFARFKNAGCNTSGILAKTIYIRIRPSSRTTQLISAGYTVENQIDNFLLSFKLQIKLTSSWRQIIHLKTDEGCKILASKHPIDLLNKIVETIRGLFPTFVASSCPIKPGRYYSNNTVFDSMGSGQSSFNDIVGALTVGQLPNGLYRTEVRVTNGRDPIGATFWVICELYQRNSNETNF